MRFCEEVLSCVVLTVKLLEVVHGLWTGSRGTLYGARNWYTG